MSWTEKHYASEHNDGEHFDCAQNIFSIVVYVWSGVLLFLHCGIRPLPRGRSNESKNNFIGKENILQKGSSESRNKIIAIVNNLQRFMGLAFSLQRQSCSLWWTVSNPALFHFFSWRRNLFAALRLWLVSSPTENRFSNFVIQVTTYQKQYFYTDSLESATEFVRAIADDIKRPFSVRFFAIAIGVIFYIFLSEVQPVHADRGGAEQLGQDLGRGEGAEGGPGHRGQRLEESQ